MRKNLIQLFQSGYFRTMSAQVITLIWLYFTSLILHAYSTICFRMNRLSPQIYWITSRSFYNRALIDRGYASIWLDSKTSGMYNYKANNVEIKLMLIQLF